MTHYKKHWLILLATRLAQGKKIVIKKSLYAQFLCYAITSEFLGPAFIIEFFKSETTVTIKPK
jgi:hypothetical protein